ncbi:Glutamate-rich WD-repeat protein [Spironucleus salmonicida]|uniref:Glutamate-rich WD-repeat protein n=1 Tax=Spironucleus salmonicida TaxID=348837 RepID=V6LM71_9EUKA|nr:Glutamate-rich WD-repeat protein [Spironucleus salmonicida]|eukprot:EST45787.1 Glutamate-rich WD-repeat protein [Spironucleus salmonicida]
MPREESSEFSSSSSIQQEQIENDNDIENYKEADLNALNQLQVDEQETQDKTYIPQAGQQDLEANPEAYDCLLKFDIDWPILSLDFVNLYTATPTSDPQLIFLGGSQTDGSEKPQISLFSIQNFTSYSPETDPEAELETFDVEPIFQRRVFDVKSNVTRVKSNTQFLQNRYTTGNAAVFAFWQDNGQLTFQSQASNLKSLGCLTTTLGDFNSPQTSFLQQERCWCGFHSQNSQKSQVFNYNNAGYGIDFHSLQSLAIAGNSDNILNAFQIQQDGKVIQDATNFSKFAQNSSIEDVKFAHTGQFLINAVFGACSTSGEFQLIDPRASSAGLVFKASGVDVNVFDFDYANENLVYLGDENGVVRVFDVRNPTEAISEIKYHNGPITSLKSSPCTEGLIACSDDNGAVVFWQMDAEDDEEALILKQQGLPKEFLFLHLGVEEPREISWCGSHEGYLAIAEMNGIQLIRPINLVPE